MDKFEAKQTLVEMRSAKVIGRESIRRFLLERRVSFNDWPLIMICMIETDFHKYSFFIFTALKEDIIDLAKSEHSKALLECLALIEDKEEKNYLSFLSQLDSVSNSLLEYIYDLIKDSNIKSLKIASGLVLGRLSSFSPNLLFKEIENAERCDEVKKISLMLALQILASLNENLSLPNQIKEFVIECTKSREVKLSYHAIKSCIMLQRSNDFAQLILEYVQKSDEHKIHVCDIIRFCEIKDGELELQIIQECGKTESLDVINWVSNVIGDKLYGSDVPHGTNMNIPKLIVEALNLLRVWSHNKGFQSLDTQWMLERVAKIDLTFAIKFLEKWIENEEDEILAQFFFPKILRELFKNHKKIYIDTMKRWLVKGQFFIKLLIFSVKELLDDIKLNYDSKLARYNCTIRDLSPYVKKYGLDLGDLSAINDINLIILMIPKVTTKTKSLSLEKTNPDIKSIEVFLKELSQVDQEVKDDIFISNECLSIMKAFCTERRIDDKKLTREFNDNRIQSTVSKSIILIDALTRDKRFIDYDITRQNLRHYTKICDFLSTKWFDKQIKDSSEHPLLMWLSKFDIDLVNELLKQFLKETDEARKGEIANRIRMPLANQIYVNHLERCLNLFGDRKSYRVARIRDGLQKEEDFYQTVSHLEVATALKENNYDIEIEDDSLGRPLDIVARKDGHSIILEVTSIDMIVGLKYGGFQSNVPNKIRSTILKKLENQIKYYADKSNDPIIVVIDNSRARDLSIEDVVFALYGSPAVSIVTNNETGKIVETYPTLSKNGITETNETAKNLSAVILYNNEISWNNLTVKLSGRLVINRHSSRKLDFDKAEDLSYSLFGHRNIYR